MELPILLVADYANLSELGKLNVMGIFTTVYARQVPARHPEMYLIGKFTAGPAEYNTTRRLTIKLLNQDATKELLNWSQVITVPTGTAGRRADMNFILQLRDIVFPDTGAYQFSVLVDNDEKGTLPLEVVLGLPPGKELTSPGD